MLEFEVEGVSAERCNLPAQSIPDTGGYYRRNEKKERSDELAEGRFAK